MKHFIEISKYAGMREDLVQAGGGNTSIKLDDKRMAIKASGIQLAEISETAGYSIVDFSMIAEYMKKIIIGGSNYSEGEILERALINGKRSSIETFLHAVTGKLTLHTHPVAVNILATRTGGMKALEELFPEALMVSYATPGLELAKLYYQTFLNYNGKETNFHTIFLKNHGLIVSGNTADEVIERCENINQKIGNFIGLDHTSYHHAYEIYKKFLECGIDDKKIVVKVENKNILDTFYKFNYSLWDYQMCPDCIVFCGKAPFLYNQDCNEQILKKFIDSYGAPIIIQYDKDLFIRAETVKKAKEIESVLALSSRIALFNKNEPVDLLTPGEQSFLLNWDSEQYRQKL